MSWFLLPIIFFLAFFSFSPNSGPFGFLFGKLILIVEGDGELYAVGTAVGVDLGKRKRMGSLLFISVVPCFAVHVMFLTIRW